MIKEIFYVRPPLLFAARPSRVS